MRRRRQELGWSQHHLAERSGLHRTYVAEVELGKRNLGLVNIARIATALELEVAGLFAAYDAAARKPTALTEKGNEGRGPLSFNVG